MAQQSSELLLTSLRSLGRVSCVRQQYWKAEQSVSVSSFCQLRCLLFSCSLWLYPYCSHPANSTSQIRLGDSYFRSFHNCFTVFLTMSSCLFFALRISETKDAHFTRNSSHFPGGFVDSDRDEASFLSETDLSWQDQVMEVQAIQFTNSSLRTLNAFWWCLSRCPATILLPAVSLFPRTVTYSSQSFPYCF